MAAAPRPAAPVLRPWLAAHAGFRFGVDTPRAFLERCLATVDAREAEVGAFVHYDADMARQQADAASARWRAGQPLSPIDGMPVGIKDIIETADFPTGMGSPLFEGWRSGRDAASVAALREAGGVILGKTVTTEFAATEPRGTRNPHDARRTPGGSSSGSAAAVAAGMISAGLGTQVIGSIIRPASFCGCIGFKPTVGAINRGGSHDGLSQSCDGVLAAALEDAWQVAYEIAVRAGGDPGFAGLIGPAKVPPAKQPRAIAALETEGWEAAEPEARLCLEEALYTLAKAGIEVLRRDEPAVADVEDAVADAFALSRAIVAWESRWPINVYRNRDAAGLSRMMLERLAEAEAMSIGDYRALLKRRANARARYEALARLCDACITLSALGAAPLGLASTGDPRFAVPSSLLGVPALSLPAFEIDGLPLGLQVIGFEDNDADLFAHAAFVLELLAKSEVE
jgi:Asp-tRNA(Asn)/Glu-tRNA(Gln) amidotransferase A subunit family amidase